MIVNLKLLSPATLARAVLLVLSSRYDTATGSQSPLIGPILNLCSRMRVVQGPVSLQLREVQALLLKLLTHNAALMLMHSAHATPKLRLPAMLASIPGADHHLTTWTPLETRGGTILVNGLMPNHSATRTVICLLSSPTSHQHPHRIATCRIDRTEYLPQLPLSQRVSE